MPGALDIPNKHKKAYRPLRNVVMIAILLLVIPLLIILSISGYLQSRTDLMHDYQAQQRQTENNIANAIILADNGYRMLERSLDNTMRNSMEPFVKAYKESKGDPSLIDLKAMSAQLSKEYDAKFDLYLIDGEGVVSFTSYDTDLGLDFKQWPDFYNNLMKLRAGSKLSSDRISTESRTGLIRKYAYMPTPDHKYVMEIGMIIGSFSKYMTALDPVNLSGRLKAMNPSLDSVRLYDKKGFFVGADRIRADSATQAIINTVSAQKKEVEIYNDELGTYNRYLYVDLFQQGDVDDLSRIVMLTYNTRLITGRLSSKAQTSALISIIGLALCIVCSYFIALYITRPVNRMAESVRVIAAGDLTHKVNIRSKNEIGVLAGAFNNMTDQLRGLVEGLEEKVKERTHQLTEKNAEIETQNIEIKDSIKYAKRIQEAILPEKQLISSAFNDSFILFKPKDIVSGDFYWFSKTQEKIFIAAVDCTGHGVPGAFMSMIGSSSLNEIINEKRITRPDEILDSLRENIIRSLKQSEAEGSSRDGMDISLCAFDLQFKTLQFAAANNSAYVIRDKELLVLKADKQPIGIHTGEPRPFTMSTFQLQKGDAVYLFSDGYADQFGGPKGKKFKYKQMEDLLISINDKPMSAQHSILDETIEAWRGGLEQVDDILMIGIKI